MTQQTGPAIRDPETRRDQQINDQTIPKLASQVLSAHSARIDGVSVAIYRRKAM